MRHRCAESSFNVDVGGWQCAGAAELSVVSVSKSADWLPEHSEQKGERTRTRTKNEIKKRTSGSQEEKVVPSTSQAKNQASADVIGAEIALHSRIHSPRGKIFVPADIDNLWSDVSAPSDFGTTLHSVSPFRGHHSQNHPWLQGNLANA